jgi:hypothetical protein
VSGLRLHHVSASSVTYTLVDGSRPYQTPIDCWRCARTHLHKTYHLDLDGTGHVIVSAEIWDRLQRIPDNPFTLANEVAKPPRQRLSLGKGIDLSALRPVVPHQEKR